jgi:hypothetical protein
LKKQSQSVEAAPILTIPKACGFEAATHSEDERMECEKTKPN